MTTNEVIKNADLYTMEDWHRDGYLKVKVGQVITPEVFWELADCVPPQTLHNGIFQVGEPDSHDWNTGEALYQTFEKVSEDYHYRYIGLRP